MKDKYSTRFIATRRRKGVALVLVMTVMALVAVMGYAMLSSSILQGTASENSISAAIADAQAESGVNLVLYYMQNPLNAPGVTNGVWPATWTMSNVTFSPTSGGSTMPGSVSLTVTNVSSNTYSVTAVGSSGASGGGAVTRTVVAVIQVNTAYLINQAMASNSTVKVPSGVTFTGTPAIVSSSTVTLSGGTVNGNIQSPSYTKTSGTLNGQAVSTTPTSSPAPASANVNYYLTYSYQGSTYAAQALSSGSLSNAVLSPNTTTNPLGVFYYAGNLTISNVSIAGTLVVKGGTLTVATNTTNTIVAQSGMPAIVVDDILSMAAKSSLTATGVVWAGQGVTGTVLTPSLTINGALLVDQGTITWTSGTFKVTYPTGGVSVPQLSSANQTPQSAQIISWSQGSAQ